ncbi:MAG: hydrogenase maturation protease [Bacilli bacterium]
MFEPQENFREAVKPPSTHTVVIGLGNPLMSDEGIGSRLITEFAGRSHHGEFAGVLFLDLGTSGAKVLHAIAQKRKAIFLDCVFMGEEPGAIRRFTPDDVHSLKLLSGFSFHEADLLAVLELSRKLGEHPREVVLFGIEPLEIVPGETLSSVLQARVKEYVVQIQAELQLSFPL